LSCIHILLSNPLCVRSLGSACALADMCVDNGVCVCRCSSACASLVTQDCMRRESGNAAYHSRCATVHVICTLALNSATVCWNMNLLTCGHLHLCCCHVNHRALSREPSCVATSCLVITVMLWVQEVSKQQAQQAAGAAVGAAGAASDTAAWGGQLCRS
jgi:hypothetical protein